MQPHFYWKRNAPNQSRLSTERLVVDNAEFQEYLLSQVEDLIVPPIMPTHLPKPDEVAHRLASLELFLELAGARMNALEQENAGLKTRVGLIERAMGVDYEQYCRTS